MEANVLAERAAAQAVRQQYFAELKATVSVVIWLDAESADQARDIAAQWQPDRYGCHEVKEYYADSTANGAYVPLQEPVDLDWELENVDVEDMTVEPVAEETTDDKE